MAKRIEYDNKPLKIEELIDEAIRLEGEAEEPRDYIGASIIAGKCERAIWYGFRWFGQPDFPPRIRRRFKTGDSYEERVNKRLEATGRFTVRSVNPRARNDKKQYAAEYGPLGGLMRGHLDGFVTSDEETWLELGVEPEIAAEAGSNPVLLETKVLASAKYGYDKEDHEYLVPIKNKGKGKIEGRWFELHRKGVLAAQVTHFGQMQSYMGMSRCADRSGKIHFEKWGLSGPLNHALYIGVNGDTDQWHAELLRFSTTWWDHIVSRVIRVVRAKVAPPRISENPGSWDCHFCDFLDMCHGDDQPDRSCRSCVHASLKIPGDQKFWGKTAAWFCGEHSSGCGDFTACDSWRPIKNPVDMF